jgi:vacuolar-type H+-ATPase subunit F/Vma7
MKGILQQNGQIIHKLRELEFEIDSLKLDFDERKSELKNTISKLKPETLFKFIVVCNTLIPECREETGPIVVNVVKDMVSVPNPYRKKDPTSSRLKMQVCFLNNNCETDCPNCTLFKNMVSIYHSYARIILANLRGKSNTLFVISDLIFTILRFGSLYGPRSNYNNTL